MKVFILAGGYGTRLSEFTSKVPKPSVMIGNKPMIFHIMEIYSKQGFNEFVILLGYKSEILKRYFINYSLENSDLKINFKTGKITKLWKNNIDWKVTLVDTGMHTMTGGRLLKAKKYINGRFLMTYGDGLGNVNISNLLKIHNKKKSVATITAVRPTARFGEVTVNNDIVKSFEEKKSIGKGYINGGFFVFEPEILNYIDNFDTMLERKPFSTLCDKGKLSAYCHEGFWQCMDNKREYELLNQIEENETLSPWLNI
ncbi:sugar phosphate nucleotidyltransferase [Candidatus Pelagibacter sp. HIMB1695]|uniref:sugar phosphate nucleotidyltransferase n=1 Tax=Candidatus Pelagibacter sp. HIMB1695 TaxID=3413364 RepID=UPI003F8587A4